MSREHLSRYSERLNLVEYREKMQRRRKEQSEKSNSLPPKYRTINKSSMLDIYSNSTFNVPVAHVRETSSQNRLNLNEVQLSLNILQLDPVDRIVLRVADERDAMQKKTFENWINNHMAKFNFQIRDIFQDLRDGTVLLMLLKHLSGENLFVQRGHSRFHHLENINTVLNFLRSQNVRFVNIHADDLVDGNPKLTLGLVWIIILFYQFKEIVQSDKTEELSVRKILLQWSRKSLEDYPDISIEDFSSSWKDGKAFLALIHRHRPHLIDYKASIGKSAQENLNMAFNTAEKDLGVPKILDPKDVMRGNSDERSMMTYVASLYDVLPSEENNPMTCREKSKQFNADYVELEKYLKLTRHGPDTSLARFKQHHDKQLTRFNRMLSLYEDISDCGPVADDITKKYEWICNEWSQLETRIKERNLLQSNEHQRHKRSELVSRKLEQDHKLLSKLIDKSKIEMKNVLAKLRSEPSNIISQEVNNIEKNLSVFENQISNMIVTVQELRRESYEGADMLYRKVVNLESSLDGAKNDYEKLMKKIPKSISLSTELYTPVTIITQSTDRKQFINLDKFLATVDEMRRVANEIKFTHDLKEMESNYARFMDVFTKLKNSESTLDELFAAVVSHKDGQIFESKRKEVRSEYDETMTFFTNRERDIRSYRDFLIQANEMLLWIREKEDEQIKWQWFDSEKMKLSEKQEKFKNLIDELEMKETSINSAIAVGTTLVMNGHAAVHCIQKILTTLKSEWQWSLNLAHCLKTHLENLALYEQFFHDACEADNTILDLTKQLNTKYFRPMGVQLDEGEILSREIQEMLFVIETLKEQVDRLIFTSQSVSALSLRTTPILSSQTVHSKAICSSKESPDCSTRTFSDGEQLRLVNNASSEIWQLENSKKEMIDGPAVCFVITEISPQASLTANTLHSHWNHLKELWNERELQLREEVLYATMQIIKNWGPEDFRGLDKSNRQKVIEILNSDANRFLMDLKCFNLNDTTITKFQAELNLCNARFSELARDVLLTKQQSGSSDRQENRFDQGSIMSIKMQIDDLINCFTKMEHELRHKLRQPVILDVSLLENQVAEHKEFENTLKNNEPQVNNVIALVKQGGADTIFLKPTLEEMIEVWETLWHDAHMFVVRLKTTEMFFSQLDEIDQIICETELTLADQSDSFPAGTDQIEILLGQLESAQGELGAMLENLQACPDHLDQLGKAIIEGRKFLKGDNYDDLEKLSKELEAIQNRYDVLKSQINKRLNLVKECKYQYTALKTDLSPTTTWMVGLQTRVDSQITPYASIGQGSIEQSINKINGFLDEMTKTQTDMVEINKSATYFLGLVQKYESLVTTFQAQVESQNSLTSNDFYGFNKRSRVQNARDKITSQISKLNNDFNQTAEYLQEQLAGYRELLIQRGSSPFCMPEKMDIFDSFEDKKGKRRYKSQSDGDKIPKQPIIKRHNKRLISNLNRSQLTNLWYFSSLISEHFSPISLGDCFRYRLIKLDSNVSQDSTSEPSMTLEEALQLGHISRKSYELLTRKVEVRGVEEPFTILEMMKTNYFNIFNGTINDSNFSESLTVDNAIRNQLINTTLGNYLNCMMISSMYLVHAQPDIVCAAYSPEQIVGSTPLISLSDCVDLNLCNPPSNTFINPFDRTEKSFSQAIEANYINQHIPEIVVSDPNDHIMHLTVNEAVKSAIFNAESGCILTSQYSDEVPLPFARQDGILARWGTILDIILEHDQPTFMLDRHNVPIPINDALERRILSGDSEFMLCSDAGRNTSLKDAAKNLMITDKGLLSFSFSTATMTFTEALHEGLISVIDTAVCSQISEVFDPSQNGKLSLHDAIKSGIIDPKLETYFDSLSNERMSLKTAFSKQNISKQMYIDLSVYCGIRNANNVKLNVLQAIAQNLFDYQTGRIKHSTTGDWDFVTDLFRKGSLSKEQYNRLVFLTCPLIKYSLKLTDVVTNIDMHELELIENSKILEQVTRVFDSNRNQYIDLQTAIDRGIIDLELGLYHHKRDNTYFTLLDAIDEDFVKVRDFNSNKKLNQIKTSSEENDAKFAIESVFNPLTRSWISVNHAIDDEIIDQSNCLYRLMNDDGVDKNMSIDEAISAGYIKTKYSETKSIDTFNYGTNNKLSTLSTSHVTIIPTETLVGNQPLNTLNDIIENELIDPDTGLVRLPGQSRPMSIHDIITKGLIDIDNSYVKDPDKDIYVNLRDAIRDGLLDPINSTIRDKCGNNMSLLEAVDEGLFDISQEEATNTSRRDFVTKTSSRADSLSNEVVPNMESDYSILSDHAIDSVNSHVEGPVIENDSTFGDTKKRISTQIPEEEKVVERICVIERLCCIVDKLDVISKINNQIILDNQIDAINHTVKDPYTGLHISFVEALENGLLYATISTLTNKSIYLEIMNERHFCYQILSVYDPLLNRLEIPNEALSKKHIDLTDSTYFNPKTNERSTLSDALQQGLVHTALKTRPFVPLSYPFTSIHIRTCEEEENFIMPYPVPDVVRERCNADKSWMLSENNRSLSLDNSDILMINVANERNEVDDLLDNSSTKTYKDFSLNFIYFVTTQRARTRTRLKYR